IVLSPCSNTTMATDIVVVLVELVEEVLVVVVLLVVHNPLLSASLIRNVFASFVLIVLSGACGMRTWYRSPPPSSKSRHAEVPGFGGTTVMAPSWPTATALIWKTPPPDFFSWTTLIGP